MAGRSWAHTSIADGQRVPNRQPLGGLSGLGISPLACSWETRSSGSVFGIEESSTLVYGWSGLRYNSSEAHDSTTCPRYITSTRSLMYSTTLRSWLMNT